MLQRKNIQNNKNYDWGKKCINRRVRIVLDKLVGQVAKRHPFSSMVTCRILCCLWSDGGLIVRYILFENA